MFRDDLTVEAGPGASPGRLKAQARSFAWLEQRFGPDFRTRGTDLASTHVNLDDLRAANGPVYAISGWLDGPYANAAAKRFNSSGRPGDKLLIGPWDHMLQNISPFSGGGPTRFDLFAELQKFLDGTVGGKPSALASDAPVHYYVMGAETWRASQVWPPASTPARLWFDAGGALSTTAPMQAGRDRYTVDFEATTGNRTRWDTLMAIPLKAPYPDRAERDKRCLLVFDGPVLDADTEVTGHPIVELWLTSTAEDGAFFVYLEDIRPDGTAVYVTEGQLRALHRKEQLGLAPTWRAGPYRTYKRADALPITPGEPFRLTFDILPTSYVFKAGSRIRVAIAGADKAHFARVPADPAVTPVIELLREPGRLSWIELPVVSGHVGR